jgi:hypothetical protein
MAARAGSSKRCRRLANVAGYGEIVALPASSASS